MDQFNSILEDGNESEPNSDEYAAEIGNIKQHLESFKPIRDPNIPLYRYLPNYPEIVDKNRVRGHDGKFEKLEDIRHITAIIRHGESSDLGEK